MDINKYKFKDEDARLVASTPTLNVTEGVIALTHNSASYLYLTKDDVIAMAQHFNVTEYELSC